MDLVVGHTTHDRYGDALVAGGSAYYAARAYLGLGANPHLATVVGEDFACDAALGDLSKTVVRHGNTTLFTNLYPDNSRRLQFLEAWAPMIRPEMVPEALLEARIAHLAPVMGEVDLDEWRAAVEAELVAINVQGWVRAPDPKAGARTPHVVVPEGADLVAAKRWNVSSEALRGIDVAIASDEDFHDQANLRERLVDAVPVVAVTHGSDGATIHVEGEAYEIGVVETEVRDPTGAGDVFSAGFLHRLAAGDGPVRAAQFGAAAASIVIEAPGGRALARLDEEEVRERVARLDAPGESKSR